MNHLTQYNITKLPATKWGLVNDFSLGSDQEDSLDWNQKCQECLDVGPNISECNRQVFLDNIKPWMRVIVEIGVCKNDYDQSSAKIFIENKHPECQYFGLDLEDRSSILPLSETVKFLQTDSREVEKNISTILKDHKYIDLLFIDGHHSVNMVLNDWQYAKFVRPEKGVVIVHDTNFHPGPWCLIESVDTDCFDVKRHCVNKEEFGISVLKRK